MGLHFILRVCGPVWGQARVLILFQSDGVFYCLKDVDRTDSLAYFQSFKGMETQLYAVKEDLDERSISEDELAADITVIPRQKAFELFQENDFNMDF